MKSYHIDINMMICFPQKVIFINECICHIYKIDQCLSSRIKLHNLRNSFSKLRYTYQSSFNIHHQDNILFACFLIINTYCCNYLNLFASVQCKYKYGSIQDNKKRLQCSFKIITFSALMKRKENSQLGYANQYQHF